MKDEWKKFLLILGVFLAAYYIPFGQERVQGAILEALAMLQEYAREHVLFCLVPAFFIAGGISVFISQASVMKYFGAQANKALSYGVASVSGAILAVCSCTVLPLFAGIYKRRLPELVRVVDLCSGLYEEIDGIDGVIFSREHQGCFSMADLFHVGSVVNQQFNNRYLTIFDRITQRCIIVVEFVDIVDFDKSFYAIDITVLNKVANWLRSCVREA